MFQDFALFPHKSVAANVAFGLRMQKLPRDEIDRRVNEMLALVHLTDLAHRDVNQLSGGERQRVALARSLAPRPALLMLDEPIGSLDRTLRDRLLEELRRILKQVGVTVVYVTHDQGEAFAIADRVILIREGKVVQSGKPEDVYRQPADAWVAQFLGMQNLLPGKWVAEGWVRTAIGTLQAAGCGRGDVTLLIRPEAAELGQNGPGAAIRGAVIARSFFGVLVRVTVRVSAGPDRDLDLVFDLPAGGQVPQVGRSIVMRIRPHGVVCLP
jgi:ABC-type Fe3+/spermidine/putrescine transport system ATPase subunit